MTDKKEVKVSAEEFRRSLPGMFRAADKGKDVTITHVHYPERDFKLVAEDKGDKDE